MLEQPICDNPECEGTNEVCQKDNTNKGCPCLESVQLFVHQGDRDFMDNSYKTDWLKPFGLDGGNLTCGGSKNYGEPLTFFTLNAITTAAEDFCKERVAAPFKWSGADVPDTKGEGSFRSPMKEAGDFEVLVSMTWSDFSVPNQCPELDMGASDALQLCKDRFGLIINNCNTSNVESVERWKQGGFYDKDYVHWYIATQTIKGE